MKLRNTWGLLLLAALSVASAAAASCSAGNSMFTSGTTGGSGGATATGSMGTGNSGGIEISVGSGPGGSGVTTGPTGSTGAGGGAPDACTACAAAGGQCIERDLHASPTTPGTWTPGRRACSRAAAARDPAFSWLYPYDKTVFPRGLIAPTLQFAGTRADARSTCTSRSRARLQGLLRRQQRQAVRALAGRVERRSPPPRGATDPVKVEVTKIAGGAGRRARSPRRGRSRRAASAAPSTTRRTARRSLGGVASVGHHEDPAGRHGADGRQERLRQRLPHRERRRLDARRQRGSLGASTSASYDLTNNAAVIHDRAGASPSPTAASTPTGASSCPRRTTGPGSGTPSRLYDTGRTPGGDDPRARLGRRHQRTRHAGLLARRQEDRLQPRGHGRRAHARGR